MSKLKPTPNLSEAIEFSHRLIDTSLWIRNAEELQAAAAVLEIDIRLYWSEEYFGNMPVEPLTSQKEF